MEDSNINITESTVIKKYCIIREKNNKKSYLAYILKANNSNLIGYKVSRGKKIPCMLNCDNIASIKPYKSCVPDNCDLGLNSIILLACF